MGSRTKTMLGQIEITRNVKSTKASSNVPKSDSTQAYVNHNAEEMLNDDSNVVCIATEAQYYQTNELLEHADNVDADANEIVEGDHLLILEEPLPSSGAFDQQQHESNQSQGRDFCIVKT